MAWSSAARTTWRCCWTLLHDGQLPAPPGADWLDELNPYAVEARYGVPGIAGLDRPKVLAALRALLQWTRAQLRGSA